MRKLLIFIVLCSFLAACQGSRHNANNKLNGSNSSVSSKNGVNNYASITKNPWQFIQNKTNFDIPDNNRINAERERILRNPKGFESIASRSEPYVYYIINQLSKNQMPVELALLPLIESAYDPLATSPAKAAGLWQFVPITAKEYGLERNSSFDARRDLIKSTDSAISLLQNLNSRFDGDWLLTLAAYNAGEGRVRKAIAKNQANGLPTNYWALDLPKETMQYVPKVLAVINIIKNNRQYGVNLPEFNYQNSLVRIDISKNISLAKIAKYAEMPLDDLTSFNAGYVKQTVNGPFHLLVPYVYAENLYQKLQADKLVSNEITELVQDIPHNREPINIKSTNLKYSNINNKELVAYTASLNNKSTSKNKSKSKITYLVKAGDNLYSIAQNYRVKITDILEWNKMKKPAIKVGDRLTINVVSANPI